MRAKNRNLSRTGRIFRTTTKWRDSRAGWDWSCEYSGRVYWQEIGDDFLRLLFFFPTFMAPAGWDKAFLVFPDLEKLAMAY